MKLTNLKNKIKSARYRVYLKYLTLKRITYWNYRYAKGWILREEPCGDCECRGCRGECCGACGW